MKIERKKEVKIDPNCRMDSERVRVSWCIFLPGIYDASKRKCGVMWFKYYKGYYDVRKYELDSVSEFYLFYYFFQFYLLEGFIFYAQVLKKIHPIYFIFYFYLFICILFYFILCVEMMKLRQDQCQ